MQKSTSIITLLLALSTLMSFGQNTADITPLSQCGSSNGSTSISFVFNSTSPANAGPFAILVYDQAGGQIGGQISALPGDTITFTPSLATSFYAQVMSSNGGMFVCLSDTFDIEYSATTTLPDDVYLVCGTNFTWSAAGIDTTFYINGTHALTYTNYTALGCAIDTVQNVIVAPYVPSICVVTDEDNDGHNEIVFDISGGADYNIYRGSTLIHTRLATDADYFEDTLVLNSQFAYTYSIEAVDACGTSPASDTHTAIKLTTGSAPDSNTVNLSWNSYEGVEFSDEFYVIERTRAGQTDSIWGIPVVDYDQNPTSVTLSGHQAGDVYQVIVGLELTCIPQRSEAPAIRSNLLNPNATGIEDAEAIRVMLPNPSDGLHLQSDRALDVTVTDINGRLIASHQGVVVVNERYMSGMYFVNLTDGVHVVTKRLVVTQ